VKWKNKNKFGLVLTPHPHSNVDTDTPPTHPALFRPLHQMHVLLSLQKVAGFTKGSMVTLDAETFPGAAVYR
jgi:hypothetical protein